MVLLRCELPLNKEKSDDPDWAEEYPWSGDKKKQAILVVRESQGTPGVSGRPGTSGTPGMSGRLGRPSTGKRPAK